MPLPLCTEKLHYDTFSTSVNSLCRRRWKTNLYGKLFGCLWHIVFHYFKQLFVILSTIIIILYTERKKISRIYTIHAVEKERYAIFNSLNFQRSSVAEAPLSLLPTLSRSTTNKTYIFGDNTCYYGYIRFLLHARFASYTLRLFVRASHTMRICREAFRHRKRKSGKNINEHRAHTHIKSVKKKKKKKKKINYATFATLSSKSKRIIYMENEALPAPTN